MEFDYVIQVAEFEPDICSACSAQPEECSLVHNKTWCDVSFFIVLHILYSRNKIYNIRSTELFLADE
jgi:hypothetical protein